MPAMSETTILCAVLALPPIKVTSILIFVISAKIQALPHHSVACQVTVCVGGIGSLMGHAVSFLAISPSFID